MEASSFFPLDILLEIVARSDPVTLLRCGATCKLLWRHVVADPAFRGSQLRSADRFLLGLFYRYDNLRIPLLFVLANSPSARPPASVASSFMRGNAGLLGRFGGYDPVASRDGLLVLRSRVQRRLCVCNPVTGQRSFLPPAAIDRGSDVPLLTDDDHNNCLYVPLLADDGGLSFKLLAVNRYLSKQTFSSEAHAWGAITTTQLPILDGLRPVQFNPVVLRGVAYWLYQMPATRFYHVVAMDVGTGQARSTEVPQYCHRLRAAASSYKELLLTSSSAEGRLSLLVAEYFSISVWMPPPAEDDSSSSSLAGGGGRWARTVLIERTTILRSVEPVSPLLACQSVNFEWFGERSGIVVLQMHGVGLLLLNLRSKQIHQLQARAKPVTLKGCGYELDLLSLLPPLVTVSSD